MGIPSLYGLATFFQSKNPSKNSSNNSLPIQTANKQDAWEKPRYNAMNHLRALSRKTKKFFSGKSDGIMQRIFQAIQNIYQKMINIFSAKQHTSTSTEHSSVPSLREIVDKYFSKAQRHHIDVTYAEMVNWLYVFFSASENLNFNETEWKNQFDQEFGELHGIPNGIIDDNVSQKSQIKKEKLRTKMLEEFKFFYKRESKTYAFLHPSDPAITKIGQAFGRATVIKNIDDSLRVEYLENQTLSSAAIKNDHLPENAYMKQHNANLAVVVDCCVEGKPHILAIRSARSDNPERIQELLGFSAQQYVMHQPEVKTIQPMLISALDPDLSKTILTVLWSGENENERSMRQRLYDGVDGLFHQKEHLTFYVENGGNMHSVLVKKPAIFYQPLSGAILPFSRIKQARKLNQPSMMQLLPQFLQAVKKIQNQSTNTPGFSKVAQEFWSHEILAPLQRCNNLSSVKEALNKIAEKVSSDENGIQSILSQPDNEAWQSLQVLTLIITGKDLLGQDHLKQTDTLIELLWLKSFQSFISTTQQKAALMVQCKSGLDRTGTMVGVLTAAQCYENINHQPLDITTGDASEKESKIKELQRFFTQAAHSIVFDVAHFIRSFQKKEAKQASKKERPLKVLKWGLRQDKQKAGHPVPGLLHELSYKEELQQLKVARAGDIVGLEVGGALTPQSSMTTQGSMTPESSVAADDES